MNAQVQDSALPALAYDLVPAKVSTNSDAVRKSLSVELEKYDVVVTADTLKGARTLAADLNKIKSSIDKRRKELKSELSAPAKLVDDELRELMNMCDEGREKITSQIAAFDEKQAQKAKDKAQEALSSLYLEHGTIEEFRTGDPSKWAKASALTGTGKLTAAVRREIEAVVKADTERQDQYHARIADLTRMSELYKISMPITEDDVAHILKIESTVEYNERVHEILRRTQEREELAAELAKQEPVAPTPPPADAVPVPDQVTDAVMKALDEGKEDRLEAMKREFDAHEAAEPTPAPTGGRVPVQVTCTFSTSVNPGVSPEAIERELRKVMERAGITTLTSVTVDM